MSKKSNKNLDLSDFPEHESIKDLFRKFEEKCSDKSYCVSDIVDREGNQYVDLVMEGGGVLGFALVGFTFFLEKIGIRFLRIGGTSAGSINALLLAALEQESTRTKSEKVLQYLSDINIKKFVDGGDHATDLVDFFLDTEQHNFLEKTCSQMGAIWDAYEIKNTFLETFGLNPGAEFHLWLKERLAENEIRTTAELYARMQQLPTLFYKTAFGEKSEYPLILESEDPKQKRDASDLLKIVASEVQTESKVVFPKMASLFWNDPKNVNPADYVRTSMSIPFFFRPFIVNDIPQGDNAVKNWRECVDFEYEKPPRHGLFVDGGIMSNFPINLFHADGVPKCPTFGARLGVNRQVKKLEKITGFTYAIFSAARHTLDYDFIFQHPDYRQVVARIDTGDHNWLNFDMKINEKFDLFRCGAEAAFKLLIGFDWAGYKKIRQDLILANKLGDKVHEETKSRIQSAL